MKVSEVRGHTGWSVYGGRRTRLSGGVQAGKGGRDDQQQGARAQDGDAVVRQQEVLLVRVRPPAVAPPHAQERGDALDAAGAIARQPQQRLPHLL